MPGVRREQPANPKNRPRLECGLGVRPRHTPRVIPRPSANEINFEIRGRRRYELRYEHTTYEIPVEVKFALVRRDEIIVSDPDRFAPIYATRHK